MVYPGAAVAVSVSVAVLSKLTLVQVPEAVPPVLVQLNWVNWPGLLDVLVTE
jgi:hypothetical protein